MPNLTPTAGHKIYHHSFNPPVSSVEYFIFFLGVRLVSLRPGHTRQQVAATGLCDKPLHMYDNNFTFIHFVTAIVSTDSNQFEFVF